MNKSTKVGYISSYRMPRYVRNETLLAMLGTDKNTKVYKAMNDSKSSRRYAETLWRLFKIRLRHHPDVYILGFRGAEIFLPVRLLTMGRPLIYDEFINPYLWAVEEHHKVKPGGILACLIKAYANICLRLSRQILSDTRLHAKYSANLSGLPIEKFTPLYVGTNEQLFRPARKQNSSENFEVFYYCSRFLPLHGLDIFLEAALKLKDQPIRFTLIGGADRPKSIAKLKAKIKDMDLTSITHYPWVPYEDLRSYIERADLCLGGPFGDTPQGKLVITGKTYQFLSMAKPIIVGKIDEDDGFVDRKNCLLVNQGNSRELAETIAWSYHNQDELSAIGQAGRQLYDQRFSVGIQSKELIDVLNLTFD